MRPRHRWKATALALLIVSAWLGGHHARAQSAPRTHQIYMSAVEIKGGTTADKLPPPPVNPVELSKGYGFTGPGEAEKTAPQRWEVASYLFVPGFITVPQGDTVTLTAFVVNGDHHDVAILAPDGQVVVPTAIWQRGRQYEVSFVAEHAGTYHLKCFAHAPTMTATILVQPR
jgi:plastocyanin